MIDGRLEERIECWKDSRDLSLSRIKDKERELSGIADEYYLARIGEAVALYNEAVGFSMVPPEAMVHEDIVVRGNSLVRKCGNGEEAYLPVRGGPNKEILLNLYALMRQAANPHGQYHGQNPYAQHGEYRISLPSKNGGLAPYEGGMP